MNKKKEEILEHFICTTEVNESAYNVHIKATGVEKNLFSFPLVHQSKDAENDHVTVVV